MLRTEAPSMGVLHDLGNIGVYMGITLFENI